MQEYRHGMQGTATVREYSLYRAGVQDYTVREYSLYRAQIQGFG
jgi:hypothetical protein